MNKILLSGNVGGDPEIMTDRNGNSFAKFGLATSKTWKNKEGERQTSTVWHNVVVYNKPLVTLCESYVRKGMRLLVEGEQVNRSYEDKEGNKRYVSEVQLPQFNGSIERPPKGGNGNRGAEAPIPGWSDDPF